MRLRRVPEVVEAADFLDAPADSVARVMARLVPPGPLKDALSGTWLGHALHPMLTDLPIGFWTSAFALDVLGRRSTDDAARRLVALGLLSAVPTAASGLSDWADTAGGEKRVGLAHALANSAAFGLYLASWLARRKGRRLRGIALGAAGAASATVGGYLGGHLIAALGIGVDNTVFDEGPQEWTEVGPADRLRPGELLVVDVAGVRVLLAEDGGRILALADRCTHRGGPLHEGGIDNGCVTCPWHGSVFRLDDGEVVKGPAALPQPRYEARARDGLLEVRRFTWAAS